MDSHDIIEHLRHLPHVSDAGHRFSATLKAVPEHFQVHEVMPYQPSGNGEHVYITLRRSGWNTTDVAHEISNVLGVDSRDMGWAGMKDRHALTTQTFSLKMHPSANLADIKARLEDQTPFDIIQTARHTNKIRLGHVRSNRFRIIPGNCPAKTHHADAIAIAKRIMNSGLPNFYGGQRFGRGFDNITRAIRRLNGGGFKRNQRDKFWVSVLQAAWFNVWLGERMARGDFNRMLTGDIAKKQDTGGLFTVKDRSEAQARFDQRKLTYTGPIFGIKTMPASGRAGRIEDELCCRFNVDTATLKKLKAPGSRRTALIWLDEIHIEPSSEGLVFLFELPSGCYATTLMREFIGD